METRLPRLVVILLVMSALAGCAGGTATSGSHPFTAPLMLLPTPVAPRSAILLVENDTERWVYVPHSEDPTLPPEVRGKRDEIPEAEENGETGRVFVFDKKAEAWCQVGIGDWSHYPIKADPFDSRLIWVGCNDHSPGVHADYFVDGFEMKGEPEDALRLTTKPGGLALVDIETRTVRYFGPPIWLKGPRVNEFVFEKDAVWICGSYPLLAEPPGVSRYDRRTGRVQPLPWPGTPHVYVWSMKMSVEPDAVWLSGPCSVRCHSFFARFRLDKKRLEWVAVECVWVLDRPVTLREYPDANARAVRTLSEDFHTLPVWDNETLFGPLVVVESTENWHRVITSRDETGWVRKGEVASTLRFFGWALSSADPAAFKFDEWPSEAVESACVFMSPEELVRAADLLKRAREAIPEEDRNEDWDNLLEDVLQHDYSAEWRERVERGRREWVRSVEPLVRESVRRQVEKSKAANEFKKMFEE